ncbi:AMP-binding protein [Streptomyces sp. NPDC005318]|uniref:AMP-binding protein n=1 Tax=Streptomyces sp. NPDC005318 TaxID=3157031 RepID=UPI0033B49665
MRENLADLLVETCRRFRSRTAIVRGETRITFGELEERAARLANFLRTQGVGEGDRVGIAVRNSPEYVETLLAAMWVAALPVNVNYKYKAEELFHVLEDASVRALVHDQAVGQSLATAGRRLPGLEVMIAALDGGPTTSCGVAARYEEAIREPRIAVDPSRVEGEWLLYTGGTTGLPKGVLSKHGDLIKVLGRRAFDYLGAPHPTDRAEFLTLLDELGRDTEPHVVNLVAPPAMHATGTYATLGTLLTGGTVVYLSTDSYDPADMAQLITQWRVTHLTFVGDAFARPLVDELRRAEAEGTPHDLSSLRCVHSVGAAWSSSSKAELLEFCDPEIEDVLASTETGRYAAMVTRRSGTEVRTVLEPIVELRVIDDSGADVIPGSGAVGMIAVPVSTTVNYSRASEGSTTFRVIDSQRYCIPGDLAVVNKDGTLELRGRSNRAINTGGEKVFAEEVEAVLLDHRQVRDTLVLDRPDARWGRAVVALVVTEQGDLPPSEADLRAYVSSRLANYKSPKQIRFVPEIPRNANGKFDLRWASSLQW